MSDSDEVNGAVKPGAERGQDQPDAESRARSLALLEATHAFPCQYSLTVIAFNAELVTTAVRAAVAHGGVDLEHNTIESKAGKYLSHRFALTVTGAVHVLDIYARVRAVEGVVTVI